MSLPFGEFVQVTIFVQILLSVIIYFGGKGHHLVEGVDTSIFRFQPIVMWTITAASFAVSIGFAYAIAITKPTLFDAPIAIVLGQLLFFFFGIYGVYGIRMRIRIDNQSIQVRNLFRTKTVFFGDVRSIDDRITGRYRTLEVLNLKGKRVLYVTSTFLPEYEDLVSLLKSGLSNRENK